VRRREFIAGLGSAAVWPVVALAQQRERVGRVGVLSSNDENDASARATLLAAFTQALAELGWTEGRNLRMDIRWTAGSIERARVCAEELVGLQPDVIFVDSTAPTAALQRETRTIPIVFVNVSDPVGSGFVAGLPRPSGNITGFAYAEPTLGGKWLELLREIAPGVTRAAFMFNPDTAPYARSYYLPSFEASARSLKIEPTTAPVRSYAEIETNIISLGRQPGAGLVAVPDMMMYNNREAFVSLLTRSNVPAIYNDPSYTRIGGLLSYGAEFLDLTRRAAAYVDRILRGEKPADLPVQMPVKFLMALNARTAKALGLTVPLTLLALADEVIE
jgi:putative tryptophan/tyrosine transport system substrate-binding protein